MTTSDGIGPARDRHPPCSGDALAALRRHLLPGETVLWAERPDPAREAIGPYLGCFGTGLTLLGLAMATALSFGVMSGAIPVETRLSLALLAIVPMGILIGGALLLREPRRRRERARRALHAITNRRLLTLVRERRWDTVESIAVRAIGPVQLTELAEGHGTITIETHSSRAPGSATRLTQTTNWFGVPDASNGYRLIVALQSNAD